MQRYCSFGLAALLTLSSCAPRQVIPTSLMHPDYHLRLADDLSWRTVGRGAEFVYLAHRNNICRLQQGHDDFLGKYYEMKPWKSFDGGDFLAGIVLSFDADRDQTITAAELHRALTKGIPSCK